SAELLAAATAAGVQHLAAADRRHAGAEPVTPLADEIARLKGALHRSCLKSKRKGPPIEAAAVGRADSGEARPSQLPRPVSGSVDPSFSALRSASRRWALGRRKAQSIHRPALGCQRLTRT